MAVPAIMKKAVVLLVGILASLFIAAIADSGVATFYTTYNPSACLGTNTPNGGQIVAASPEIYDNGNACGTRYSITCVDGTNNGTPHPCNGNTIEVEIVDLCPGCPGEFDLSEDAFAAIADTDAGVIRIRYDRI